MKQTGNSIPVLSNRALMALLSFMFTATLVLLGYIWTGAMNKYDKSEVKIEELRKITQQLTVIVTRLEANQENIKSNQEIHIKKH